MDRTERVKFKDSKDSKDFWEFSNFLTIAQERKWTQHAIDAQVTIQNNSPDLIEGLARKMDQLVIDQTVAWSYGPIDLDTFYTIPSHHYAEVADRMGDLYSPLVEKSIEKLLRVYTSLSNQAAEEPSQ